MRIIEIIRAIVRREKLDPTFKNSFITNDPKILSNISSELQKYVVWYVIINYSGVFHYESVERNFRLWEKESRNCSNIEYPEMIILPPKDDVAEYRSENIDAW